MDEVLGTEHGELNGWSGERAAAQSKKEQLVVVSTNHKFSPKRFVENVFFFFLPPRLWWIRFRHEEILKIHLITLFCCQENGGGVGGCSELHLNLNTASDKTDRPAGVG